MPRISVLLVCRQEQSQFLLPGYLAESLSPEFRDGLSFKKYEGQKQRKTPDVNLCPLYTCTHDTQTDTVLVLNVTLTQLMVV